MKKFKQTNTKCTTFAYIGKDGEKVEKPKTPYDTEEEALKAAFAINCQEKQIRKVAAYKCWTCGKWHIGRTCHTLTPEDKEKYKQKLKELCKITRIYNEQTNKEQGNVP